MDLEDIEHVRKELQFRGGQGTTGTQASFLELFGGDESKVDQLNVLLCKKAGFPGVSVFSQIFKSGKVLTVLATVLFHLNSDLYTKGRPTGGQRYRWPWRYCATYYV